MTYIFLCCFLHDFFSLIHVRYVGKMSRKENETPEEFGVRVQSATASALHLSTSNHTVADKVGRNSTPVVWEGKGITFN